MFGLFWSLSGTSEQIQECRLSTRPRNRFTDYAFSYSAEDTTETDTVEKDGSEYQQQQQMYIGFVLILRLVSQSVAKLVTRLQKNCLLSSIVIGRISLLV